jgi:thiol-disulfide isomerase/thioredoxin
VAIRNCIRRNSGPFRGLREVIALLMLAAAMIRPAAGVAQPGAGIAGGLAELKLTDLQGAVHSLAEFRGKIVVLNFWATWCFPCREEMPMLNKLALRYSEKDVVILAASLDDVELQTKIPRFLEKKKVTLSIYTGATPATLKALNLGDSIPATLILDRDGSAAFRILGEASRNDITKRLDWLLSDRSGKEPKPLQRNL